MNILVTGSSGFIWFHTAKKLLELWHTVIWIDCENDYYDVQLKTDRRSILSSFSNFQFYHISVWSLEDLENIFTTHCIDKVCHLAAQAGVRYSIENPFAYIEANIIWFHNIIFLSQKYKVQNFVYASSSSVYGKNEKQPFSRDDRVDHPISLYAATKKSNEIIAHSYSHIYGLPTTGLRFFTVYGEYSRPDMAMLKFALKMKQGEEIEVYNHGEMKRDFTYIDDIVDGILKSLEANFQYEIFNLWNDTPTNLEYMIELLEKNTWLIAKKKYLPLQTGDVISTWSDIEYTKEKLNWKPKTSLEEGIKKFWVWFREYYIRRMDT